MLKIGKKGKELNGCHWLKIWLSDVSAKLILEAWHSVRDRNAINEHIALPNVYNGIKNFYTH